MADRAEEEEEGNGAPRTIGLALSGSKSSAYVLEWALANFAKHDATAAATFRLIHVLTPVLAVPTPLGNNIPIDMARPDIAEDYIKKVWVKKQEMLARCKDTCDENKVEAQVMLVNGSDVAETISNLVAQYQIQVLVVGNPTRNPFASKFSRTTSKICKGVPSFCKAYIVSKDGLSSVYAPGSETEDAPSASGVPKGTCSSSSSEVFSDGTSSISETSWSSLLPLLIV